MLPIYSNTNGREVIGYAKTENGAIRQLKKMLDIHPAMTLAVSKRSESAQEILGLNAGFVYSISYKY